MSRAIFLLCARTLPGATGLALLLWAPFGRPAPTMDTPPACLVGSAAALGLFAALARRWHPPPVGRAPIALGVGRAAPAVVLGAVEEEAVWRYGAFGALQHSLGPLGALTVSTTGFALAHTRHLGVRGAASHVPTGIALGGVYLATGRIIAPIVAHVVYNLLVVAGALAWAQPPEELEARPWLP